MNLSREDIDLICTALGECADKYRLRIERDMVRIKQKNFPKSAKYDSDQRRYMSLDADRMDALALKIRRQQIE